MNNKRLYPCIAVFLLVLTIIVVARWCASSPGKSEQHLESISIIPKPENPLEEEAWKMFARHLLQEANTRNINNGVVTANAFAFYAPLQAPCTSLGSLTHYYSAYCLTHTR